MKKTPLPEDKVLKVMFARMKSFLDDGDSIELAERKSGISQCMSLYLQKNYSGFKEFRKKYTRKHKHNYFRSYEYLIKTIEERNLKNKQEIERLEALEKSELPFGIKNINQD